MGIFTLGLQVFVDLSFAGKLTNFVASVQSKKHYC